MKLIPFFFLALLILAVSSCISYKHVPYFQDLPQTSDTAENINNYKSILIQKNDILNISVTSLNPEASAAFNPPTTSTQSTAGGNNAASTGYMVDQNGEVQLPYIGDVKVEGLTTTEARVLIRKKLVDYLQEPVVRIYINNFKIGVFGGVNTPGLFPINSERVTLTDAIIMAGDLRISAKRANVLLIREVDGKRKYIRFNLNDKSTFNSPYFYLRTNDLIYIEPGTTTEQRDNILSNVGIVSSAISLISVILIFTRK